MGISRREAFEALELPFGADQDSIRTSYKRLSMKWHPERHKNSPESIKNFLEISMAYRRLNIESDIVQMSVSDCLDLYKNTFAPSKPAYSNGYSLSEDEDSEDDDVDDDIDFYIHGKYGIGGYGAQDVASKCLSAEQIEKNANDLITEEEKEKRRAEKRRAKKKRRREKKRQEKLEEEQKKKEEDQKKLKKGTKKEPVKADFKVKKQHEKMHNHGASSGSEAEDFDHSAAFFTQVVNKKAKPGKVPDQSSNTAKPKVESGKTMNGNEESLEEMDPVVLRSRQLAIEGNKMANYGHYQAAIDLFTEAVKLDSSDFRFFGNRSYCFDRMQQYEKALKDADKAIHLAPDWPKGYFRKGRALAGLKLFPDAEHAFMQVLKLDRNCEDAMQELLRVRTHQLTEMGFSQLQAQSAIRQYESVQQALDSLLAGVVAESSLAGEVYVSDDEDYGGATSSPPTLTSPISNKTKTSRNNHHKPHDTKMNSENPEGLTALWVGNVLPEVSEKRLLAMFSKYGQVTSVRLLPEKYCAFINFKTKESAGSAMRGLQGAACAGQQLLIKFPDNPIASINGANSVVMRKQASTATSTTKKRSSQHNAPTRSRKY